jgi:hypothetical protein
LYKNNPEKGIDFSSSAYFIELLRMHYSTLTAYSDDIYKAMDEVLKNVYKKFDAPAVSAKVTDATGKD